MKNKVAIVHQGFIPIYRTKTFQLLNELPTTSYTIFHGNPPANTGHKEFEGVLNFPNIRVKNVEISLGSCKIIYQPIIKHILFGNYDAVVLGHEIKFLANIVIFCLCKMIGKPVIWWGHGFEKKQDKLKVLFISSLIANVKTWLAKSADMYIVYTPGGAKKLRESGVDDTKIAVVKNTLDIEEERILYEKLITVNPVDLRKSKNLRPESVILLYVGRLYKEKRVEELVNLIKRINDDKLCLTPVECVIIGDGPELEKLKNKDHPFIHFLGAIYEQETIAQYMRISAAMVIPGKVGLAVNHAFAHGLPVITRESDLHAPEVEYIESGVNGLIIPGDFDEFVRQTVDYINSPEKQKQFSIGALSTRETLTLNFMVKAFDNAVNSVIKRKMK